MPDKRKKLSKSSRHGMYVITMIVAVMLVSLLVQSHSLKIKNAEYEAEKAELEQQISDEEIRALEISSLSEYLNSDEYIEKLAREKLGLVSEGDIIYRVAQ